MNVENVVMLCKAWNLTNAYHLIAFYYYINQLELQSYSQKTKFIYLLIREPHYFFINKIKIKINYFSPAIVLLSIEIHTDNLSYEI